MNKRKLNSWLDKNATRVDIKWDSEWCYTAPDSLITITKDKPHDLEWYIDFCKSKGLKHDVSWYTLCLLHEIGHDQTVYFLDEWEYKIDFIGSYITSIYSFTRFGLWLKCQLYFRLPTEIVATEWAVDFINNNYKEVLKLEDILKEDFEDADTIITG